MRSFRSATLLAMAGVLAISAGSALPARAADPFNIDVVVTLTGPGTFLGKAEEDTIKALEGVVNKEGGIKGRPVHFVFKDDQTQPQVAVQLMNEIISSKAAVMLGSSLAATCLAQGPLVAKSGPVQYCLSPAIHPATGSFVFSGAASTRDALLGEIRYFRARGWKRMAMISSTDASGQDADTEVNHALALPENKGGVAIVDQEHFNPTDLNVAAQMARIKASNPQIIMAYAPGTPFGTLLKGVQTAGIETPIATGNANMSLVQMKQYADITPKELYLSGNPVLANIATTPKAKQVQADFNGAFKAAGIRPDYLSTLGWDPALIVVEALRALGTSATPEQIRKWISELHDFTGVSGTYDFRDGSQRGLTVKDIVVMKWDAPKDYWTAVSDPGGLHVLK